MMGIDDQDSTYMGLQCPFDAEKRPVIYLKYVKMSYYNKK
jgi:hypothetical protein